MQAIFSKRPSPALLLALTALFVALGGGAYAAKSVDKNTVVAKSIKAGAVTGSKVRADAITSDKIADGAVGTADLADDAVTGAKVAAGSLSGADLPPITYTTAVLQNGWVQPQFQTTPASFTKDAQGFVHLRGAIKNGNGVVFTLPAGFRPPADISIATPSSTSDGGDTQVACNLLIQADGSVLPGVGMGACSNGFISLEGVTFFATQ